MKLAVVSVVIVLSGLPALAQAPAPAAAPAPASAPASAPLAARRPAGVEAALLQLEKDILAAVIKRDTAGLGSLLADSFAGTLPNGAPQTKGEFLAELAAGNLVLESSDMTDTKVRVYGEAAVVTYASTDKGKYKGEDIGGRYRWTDVFVRRGGQWRLVASQGTPVAGP